MKQFSINVIVLVLITMAIFTHSCRNPMGQQPIKEAPTQGNIRISVDESFQLLFDTQLYTFQSLYENARITPAYKPEYSVG